MDQKTFVDLSFYYMMDKYSMISLNFMMIYYPFRLFSFISRFNFSASVRGVLNTIVRMSPGLFTYFTIVLIMALSFSVSAMLLLGPFIPEMDSIPGAFFMICTVNLFDLPTFRDSSMHPNYTYFPVFAFFVNCISKVGMVVFIALTVYLFGKAVTLEKSIAVENQDEDQTEFIEEIHEKVCQLYSLNKQAGGGPGGENLSLNKRSSQTDKTYKNNKVVAWLLNRSREEQKLEREKFFRKLNASV